MDCWMDDMFKNDHAVFTAVKFDQLYGYELVYIYDLVKFDLVVNTAVEFDHTVNTAVNLVQLIVI
jgi:hypothetical protein